MTSLSKRMHEVSTESPPSSAGRDTTKRSDSPERPQTHAVVEPPKFYRGNSGKTVPIYANYLRLTVEQEKGIYEYEVRFEPRIDNRDLRFKLLNQQREHLGPTKVIQPRSFPEIADGNSDAVKPYTKCTASSFSCRVSTA